MGNFLRRCKIKETQIAQINTNLMCYYFMNLDFGFFANAVLLLKFTISDLEFGILQLEFQICHSNWHLQTYLNSFLIRSKSRLVSCSFKDSRLS